MKPTNTLTKLTLWLNRFIALLLAVLLPGMPFVLQWYSTIRTLTRPERLAIAIAFYLCAAVTGFALWSMDSLLRSILDGKVFVPHNVGCIRRIRWCCAAISLICLVPSLIYLPLCFMVVIMAFLSLVVSVVVQVMKAAVAIREENDLTI